MPDTSPIEIGILAFPNVQQLDLSCPYEVLAMWPKTRVRLVWKTPEAVSSSSGLVLKPDATFANCGRLDVICVPGGAGINPLLADEETLAFLRRQAEGARYVTSVCTGALVLGAAGLLLGKRATTHWGALDLLAPLGALPVRERIVRDGRLMTGGGVTAAIDFGLALIAELAGDATAQAIQLGLEYAPAPPFPAGDPDSAPPAVLAAVKKRMAPMRAERAKLVAEAAKRLGLDG